MELTIDGKKYSTGKLNARQQFHLARRLMPVLVARMEGLTAMAKAFGMTTTKAGGVEDVEASAKKLVSENVLLAGFVPMAKAIAQMPEADADYVLNLSLGVCKRFEGSGWADVQAANGRLMFEDLNMQGLMQLVQAVVEENCGSFFLDPSGSTAG